MRDDGEFVGVGLGENPVGGEVFVEREIVGVHRPFDRMRIVGGECEGEPFRRVGERFDGMGRMKDKVESKTAGALLLAGIGLEREREVLFEV